MTVAGLEAGIIAFQSCVLVHALLHRANKWLVTTTPFAHCLTFFLKICLCWGILSGELVLFWFPDLQFQILPLDIFISHSVVGVNLHCKCVKTVQLPGHCPISALCLCILMDSSSLQNLQDIYFSCDFGPQIKAFNSVFDKLCHSKLCLLLQIAVSCLLQVTWNHALVIQKTTPKTPVIPTQFSPSEMQRGELFLSKSGGLGTAGAAVLHFLTSF